MTAAGTFVSDNKLVVVIVSEKPNLRNYWSGRWGSVWTIDISGAKPVITGEIKVFLIKNLFYITTNFITYFP